MRIAYIATGAAGMVCGTCIHDNTLASALIKLGHEVALIPTYTPIRTDEKNVSIDRVFMGGINVYLQEKSSIFRHMPSLVDNLLNNRRLLGWVSKFSGSTKASELGEMTVSILQGEEGNQRKELMKLIDWLRDEYKPDIVQLNHSLILGFAHEIKRQLGVPVICGLQGEDLFIDALVEPYKSQTFDLLRQKVKDVDAFIATSNYYADFMAGYLRADRMQFRTVHLGIALDGFADNMKPASDEIVIGYLGRRCPEKGLHLLLDAFYQVWQKHGSKVRLKVAGYLSQKDQKFYQHCRQAVEDKGMQGAVDFVGEVDHAAKIDFLNRIDIFSMPTIYKESKGLSILEAMASGVPVVQPEHGLFPEVIAQTGGGILVEPGSVNSLAAGLETLIANPERRTQLGASGKQAVYKNFSATAMARATADVYKTLLQKTEEPKEEKALA